MFGISHRNATAYNAISDEDESKTNDKVGTYRTALISDENGFVATYKFICMDIDGINQGEKPFGYALRYDGKIIAGQRADEWTDKSIQKRN